MTRTLNEDGWYLVELKGHRRRAGQMSEVEWCGAKWVRIDTPLPTGPGGEEEWDVEHYHPSSIYGFRQVDEDEARAEAQKIWLS